MSLRADWQWENDLSVARPAAKGYEVQFDFLNNGKDAVTVTGLVFSCPCTVYHFSATTARAGEKGKLTIWIESGSPESLEDLDLIALGPPSTRQRELTIRFERTGPGK